MRNYGQGRVHLHTCQGIGGIPLNRETCFKGTGGLRVDSPGGLNDWS